MYDFVQDVLIKELVEKERLEKKDDTITKEDVLQKFQLTSICFQTIYNWMNKFGFKYQPRRKTFYVDGHERPETVEYRKGYITRYLKNEIRCHRWIQIPLQRVENLEKKYIDFNRIDGFEYKQDNLTFFEFHIDYHDTFESEWQQLGISQPKFGANLSVRKKVEENQS